mmetsp:Transcript_14607/g.30444  ORF Transcript_14607/g.30444 Transcript_14607/m.30444 type:complete len:265 (+) Transcript_14607:194-988(+)
MCRPHHKANGRHTRSWPRGSPCIPTGNTARRRARQQLAPKTPPSCHAHAHAASPVRDASCLDLEATAGTAATGLLELAALGAHARADGGARGAGGAEVPVDGAGSAAATQQHGVGAGGAHHGELVEGVHVAAGSGDAGTGTLSHAQGHDVQGGQLAALQAHIVGDGADENGELVGLAGHVAGDAGDTHGHAVGLAHTQALQHNLVELGVGTADQEAVQLGEQADVDILGLGGLAVLVARAATASDQIDTHDNKVGLWCGTGGVE